jgi:regulatory protein YycI of two-component signal transduction system YycFG
MINHLNKIFAVFAVLVFLLNLFYASFVWVNFKVNQDYIANNLCIEKDIEESTCKGNCQLKKELIKAEEKKGNFQQEPFSIAQSRIDVLFLSSLIPYHFFLTSLTIKNSFLNCQKDIQEGYTLPIFHPPIIS